MAVARAARSPGASMDSTILSTSISSLIRALFPFALCPACIAGKLHVAEDEIRNAEQALVPQAGFAVTRRICYGCGNTDDLLVLKQEPARAESRESAMDVESVRALIQRKLIAGLLPRAPMPRVWGGIGTQATCAACEEPFSKHQLAIEGMAAKETPTFHVRCFYLWEQERRVTRGT
jgi:hypothetical protein